MAKCKCGSGKSYKECCEPFIKGSALPQTAEELLRSRFVAYADKNVSYIEQTTHADKRSDFSLEDAQEWAETTQWDKLEILSTPSDTEIEFIAWYTENGTPVRHQELSVFKREENQWFFFDSRFPGQGTVVNSAPKVGRNDPCPCGSGKKYKKCCAK